MTVNNKSLKNLCSYTKGQSGNPKGRPKGSKSVSSVLKKLLNKKIEYISVDNLKKKMDGHEAIAHNLFLTAIRADKAENRLKACDMIMDRLEGKPKQSIEQTTIVDNYEDAIERLKNIALQENISLEELCDREGIDLPVGFNL